MENFKSQDASFKSEDETFTEIKGTVTIKTRCTFDESDQKKNMKKESIYSGRERPGFLVAVYPNGRTMQNRDFVSLILYTIKTMTYFEGFCIVSLIDSSGAPTFSQTYTVPYPTSDGFAIDEYISRKRLQSDPDDLLPNGILTLMIHVQLKQYPAKYDDKVTSNINFHHDFENHRLSLHLDSPLSKRLSKESIFFRTMLDTPMTEQKTRLMTIQPKEAAAFTTMASLLMGTNVAKFFSTKGIFDLYILADKYDLPLVLDTCTCFLKLYAFAHNVDELIECIDKYEDEGLKELLEKKIACLCKLNFAEEMVKTDLNVSMKQPVHECLWTYTYSNKFQVYGIVYKNTAIIHLQENFQKDKNDEYNFYK